MGNKYVSGISNFENMLWVRLKPDIEVIKKIERIVSTVETDFGEGLLSPSEDIEKIKDYEKISPRRMSHKYKSNVYAISIINNDLIDLILIKNNPIYEKVFDLYKKEFL